MGFSKLMSRCESHPLRATFPVVGQGYIGFM